MLTSPVSAVEVAVVEAEAAVEVALELVASQISPLTEFGRLLCYEAVSWCYYAVA